MSSNPLARKIRTRKLGVLIYDARTSAHKTIDECAQVVGVKRETYESYEHGEAAPSLPELELLSIFLELPLDHFWSNSALSNGQSGQSLPPAAQVVPNRQQAIAAAIQEARNQAALSLEEVSGQTGISVDRLAAYESGDTPIPLPELETLAPILATTLEAFLDQDSQTLELRALADRLGRLRELPDELQDFLSKPINRPYIDLAKRLSELPVDRLRAIAEGILEITY